MLSEDDWESLLAWSEEKILAGQPLCMPRINSEQHSTTTENTREANKIVEIGEITAEKIEGSTADGERKDEREETVQCKTDKKKTDDARKLGETKLPLVVSSEKVNINLGDLLMTNKGASLSGLKETSEGNKISIEARLSVQENKMCELIKTVNKMCTASATAMEQSTEIIKEMRKELTERCGTDKITELRQLILKDYADNLREISELKESLKNMVQSFEETEHNIPGRREEVNVNNELSDTEVRPVEEASLNNQISCIVKQHFDKLMKSERSKENDSSASTIAKEMRDALKLELVNKSMGVKRDYKLNLEMKFEHFYDYFSSELRHYGLLHIIDEKKNT